MRFLLPAVLTILAASSAGLSSADAQAITKAEFSGKAVAGSSSRDVIFRFVCRSERGKMDYLGFGLDIPNAGGFKRTFDLDQFEGPAGIGGKNHLAASGQTQSDLDFTVNGSYGENGAPATTFSLSTMARASDRQFAAKLRSFQAVVRTLGAGPSHLVYSIVNPSQSGPSFQASADLTDADAARVQRATAACAGSR